MAEQLAAEGCALAIWLALALYDMPPSIPHERHVFLLLRTFDANMCSCHRSSA
jgi:hypothetical protein